MHFQFSEFGLVVRWWFTSYADCYFVFHYRYYTNTCILDDRKTSILKKGIGIESEKVCEQVRDKKVWKQVKDGAQ